MSENKAQRTLLRGGHVVSLDPNIGDVPGGDVLIEGSKIIEVGPSLDATDAEVIDASSMVVMPGLIDTHRHAWGTAFRASEKLHYYRDLLSTIGPVFRPEDVYIGDLLGAVSALDSGVTTMLDWSHIMNTPAHADAAVQALDESGIRAIFAHGVGQNGRSAMVTGSNSQQHSEDIRRVQEEHFKSDDQLLTLAMAYGGVALSSLEETVKDVTLARELGIRLTTHVGFSKVVGKYAVTKMHEAGLLGPDMMFVHAQYCEDDEYRMIADSGGFIVSSPLNEELTGVARWSKYGIRPSLSVDTEVKLPSDLFIQMRAILWHEWRSDNASPDSTPVTVRDILEFATIEGAKATGLEHKVGTLTPGKRADIIMLDLGDILTIPRAEDPVATVVMSAQPHHVRWVFVDGQVRKRDGHLVDVDVSRLAELAQQSRGWLRKAGPID